MAPFVRLSPLIFLLCLLAGGGPSVTAQSPLAYERGVREKDPVLSSDGKDLYFTRPDHPRNQGTDGTADIWIRRRNADGKWSRPLNPGSPVNSFRDDRLLGISVDGNRLAVLRSGRGEAVLEQLVRSGRTWRISGRWALPEDAGDTENLTFNTNSQRLIYAQQSAATASLDLFQRVTLSGGKWGPSLPLPAVSSTDDERHPAIASDGRTLYFRRAGGQWMRQLDRGEAPEEVDLPASYLQLALAPGITIATTDDLGKDERLADVSIPKNAGLPSGRTVHASVGSRPAAGDATVLVPLSSGTSLAVRPDVLQRYAIVLREGEQVFPEGQIPVLSDTPPAGSLAGAPVPAADRRTRYLERTLTEKQGELERAQQSQQELYTRIIDGEDPDSYVRVRPQADRGSAIADTVPPSATESSRERYAREMAELERMKEKFRRQQDEKLRERDRRGSLGADWYAEPDTLTASEAAFLPQDPRDTTVLRSSVRSGLYPVQQPDLTERRSWERRVQGEVGPPSGSSDAGEIDAEYARKLEEVEALRSQLRRAREPDLASKSPEAGNPAGSALEITFIDNTAYPNSGGYTALDQLAGYVQKAARVVEIRVHTSPGLSARAAQLLSEERATTVRAYLREAGIAEENFRVVGYGNHEAGAGERVEVIRE